MSLDEQALAFLRGLTQPWVDLFKSVAELDLRSSTLAQDLLVQRRIDRALPGFGDFDPASNVAILPGDPASSLLYHALASPLVKPAGATAKDYPKVIDLDLIENYILSLRPLAPSTIPGNAVIAIFAYEYRPAPFTTHQRQADFVYSRTGVSRAGEDEAAWDGGNRCWLSIALTSSRFAVMPARYGAFLAMPRRRSPTEASVLGDPQDDDASRNFLVPIYKLFDGPGCIAGMNITLQFAEFHRREKLRRIFTESNIEKPPGLDGPPYLRDSTQPEKIVMTERAGASLLVSSKPEPLVRLARLASDEIATFKVPPRRALPLIDFPINRNNGSPSTFMIITGGLAIAGLEVFLQSFADVALRPRNAPEFVNIRHRPTGDPANPVDDMSSDLGTNYQATLDAGGYQAALFEDSVADGCIIVTIEGLPIPLACKPAFSVIAAPKFFPYADETDINAWVEEYPVHNRQDQFKKGGPRPLHLGRFPPNLTLFKPGSKEPAFSAEDDTAVAIVGASYIEGSGPTQRKLAARDIRPEHRTTTFLTDGCSDVFAPGWDVSFAEQDGIRFYATFGLGSPFPEDTKLCAAANGYWPAASPDAARTFHRGPTAIPMLDSELGYHPDNPRRVGPPTVGWDGEQGPFITGNVVNYTSILRSDYVTHAFRDHSFSGARLKEVDSVELIARMDALRVCIQSLPESSAEVDHTKLWLIYAEKRDAPPPVASELAGPCYRYEFVVPEGEAMKTADVRRLLQPFGRRYVCYASTEGVSWATSEAGPFTFRATPGLS
jgi:hypothetical protein